MSSSPPERPTRRRRLVYSPVNPHEAAKQRARAGMVGYLQGRGDVFQNNVLMSQLLSDMASFMDDLLINRSILNREYALLYIRELEHAQVPADIIMLLRSRAMELENTNMLEDALVGKSYRLGRINGLRPQVFGVVMDYTQSLNSYNVPSFIINQLAHNLRLFLLAMVVNNTRAYIDKTLALEYIREIVPHISANLAQRLTTAANTLPNTQTPFLATAVEMARSSNELLLQALSSELSSDSSSGDENEAPGNTQVTQYVTFPGNLDMQEQFNRSLTAYQHTLSRYYPDAEGQVIMMVNNAVSFVTDIINQVPINVNLGNRYIISLQDYFTVPAVTYMRAYMNSQPLTIPGTPGLFTMVNTAEISHNMISGLRQIDATFGRVNAPRRRADLSKTPLGSIKSIAKTPVSESEGRELEGVYERPFIGFVSKLKKIQAAYTKECQDLVQIKNTLLTRIDKYRNTTTRIRRVDPLYCLAAAYKMWKELPPRERVRFSLLELNYRFEVTYREGEGIGEGVARDFIQNCMNELLKYKVFVAVNKDEPVLRYVVNEAFAPSETFIEKMGGEYDKELFFVFVGRLLGLVLLNEVGLHFNLSYAILAVMVYKVEELDVDDLIGCYMLDYPVEFKGLLNLMKTPDDIAYVELNLLNGDAVDKNNFRVWLGEIAQVTYRNSLKLLGPGFEPLRKLLRDEKVPFSAIDKLITFETVNADTLKLLIANLQRTTPVGSEVMVSILQDKGRSFPYEVIGIDKPSRSNGRSQVFFQFIEKLLLFWSSLKHYVPSFNYGIVRVRDYSDPSVPLEQRPLPVSHTCFTRIDIPESYYDNRDMLYKKLVQAVYAVEEGIGLLGGKNKKRNK